VKLNALPVVAEAGAETVKWVAAPALTVMEFDVPVIEAFSASVPVMIRLPAVASVADNVLVPFVNVVFAGNVAAPSLEVKCTTPP